MPRPARWERDCPRPPMRGQSVFEFVSYDERLRRRAGVGMGPDLKKRWQITPFNTGNSGYPPGTPSLSSMRQNTVFLRVPAIAGHIRGTVRQHSGRISAPKSKSLEAKNGRYLPE